MKKPDKEKLINILKETKLHKKYFNDIETNLINYYLNITAARNFEKNRKKQEKITSYFIK